MTARAPKSISLPTRKTVIAQLVAQLFVGGMVLGAAMPASAAICNWSPPTGNWSVAANWLCGNVPTASDTATLAGGQTATVTAGQGPTSVNNAGTVNIANNSSLTILGTNINTGTINLQSVGNLTDLIISGAVALNGSGSVNLSDDTQNRIYGSGASLAIGAGQTIQGAGQLGVGISLAITNDGTVIANQTNALTLSTSSGVQNNSVLRSDGAGTRLVIANTAVTQVGSGTLNAINSGTVVLNNASVSGGSLTTATGGAIVTQGASSSLSGVTNMGTLNIVNNSGLNLTGTLTNTGTINLQSVGNLTDLIVNGAQTINGIGGTINLSNDSQNRIYGIGATSALTVGGGQTVQGSGQIGVTAGFALNNAGTIIATQSNPLLINALAGVTNTGTLRADGGTLQLQTTINSASGSIEARNGSLVQLMNGAVINNANFSAATGGLIATAAGALVTLGGGTVSGPVTVTNNSSLKLTGDVTYNGTLSLASVGNLTDLILSGARTLSGPATVQLSNDTQNRIYGSTNADSFTIGSGVKVQGAGQLGAGTPGAIINNGTVIANVSNALTVIAQGGVTNNNVMRADGPGTSLTITSTNVTQSASGTLNAINNGTVSLGSGTVVTGGSFSTASGGQIAVINTAGVNGVINTGTLNILNNTSLNLDGTLTNNGVVNMQSVGNLTNLISTGNRLIDGTGTINLSNDSQNRIYASVAGNSLTLGSGQTLQGSGQIGAGTVLNFNNQGTIIANQSNPLNVEIGAGATFQNQSGGTVRAADNAVLFVRNGTTFTNNPGGSVEALANSASAVSNVIFLPGVVVTNLVGNTLSGGIWKADSVGGAFAEIRFQSANTAINVNQADIYLRGANSVINGLDAGSANRSIDQTLSSNLGALRIQEGRVFNATANSGNFINGGLLELTNGTFQSNSLTLANAASTVNSFGTSALTTNTQVNGNGQINVSNGTLTVAKGFNLAVGSSSTVAAGATLNLASATAASTIGTMTTSGALALGAQNLNVTKDYNNTNFGSGNAFNARANVSGAGNIVGVNASQTITGAVTAAGPANTWNLNLGNVRGGSSTTVNYQVMNNGTGADIRGAVQTGAPGLGNVTDARLSGSGATAGNFGPIAAGGNSGNKAVTFTATSGGSLSSQSTAVVSNFSNVNTQTINLIGTASALAVGSATPTSTPGNPVDLGNFRVSGAQPTQSFAVTNSTSGAGAERLGIGSVGTTGNFTATNNLGAGFLSGGASQPNAVGAAVSGGAAGVNNGSATIQYTTNGALIDPTFTTINANAQTINLRATGYVAADGAFQPPTSFNFGTLQVGQSASQNLVIKNTATGPSGFVEDLNVTFGASGNSQITGSGSLNGILSQANSTNANGIMTVTVTGATAGALNSNIGVNYITSGKVNGVSNGLGTAAVRTDPYNVDGTITASGNFVDQAKPVINGIVNPGSVSVNLGNVRMNTAASQNLSVLNQATGNQQANLNASIATNGAPVTAGGAITALAPGATSTNLQVGLNTSSAGLKSGSATVSLVSDITAFGNCSPNCTLNLPNQTVNVTGAVYREAAVLTTSVTPSITLAARVNGSASGAITVTNNSVDGFTEGLNVTRGATAAGFTSSGGPITNLAANASSSALGVSLVTTTAGTFSGNQVLALASNGTITGSANDNTLANVNVTLNGKVYTTAVGQVTAATTTVDFGIVRVNDVVTSKNVTVQNTANVTLLNDSLRGTLTVAGPFTTASNTVSVTGAGGASGNIAVGLNTSTAGISNLTGSVAMLSEDPDLLPVSAGANASVLFKAQVNNLANAHFGLFSGVGVLTQSGNVFTLNLGNIFLNSSDALTLRLDNFIGGPADDLTGGMFNAVAANGFTFSGFGPLGTLAAGQFSGDLNVSFLATALGMFTDTVAFNGFSHNASDATSLLHPNGIAQGRTLVINANVINVSNSVPEPGTLALLLMAAAGAALARRRRTMAH